jgi:hypothetical protein
MPYPELPEFPGGFHPFMPAYFKTNCILIILLVLARKNGRDRLVHGVRGKKKEFQASTGNSFLIGGVNDGT